MRVYTTVKLLLVVLLVVCVGHVIHFLRSVTNRKRATRLQAIPHQLYSHRDGVQPCVSPANGVSGPCLPPTDNTAYDAARGGADGDGVKVNSSRVTCKRSLVRPDVPNKHVGWQTVKSTDKNIVYSAFMDNRSTDTHINVIAISADVPSVYKRTCYLWLKHRTQPVLVTAGVYLVPETHDARYVVMIYKCPLSPPNKLSTLFSYVVPSDVEAVSLVAAPCDHPTNLVPVLSTRSPSGTVPYQYTVCVPPLYTTPEYKIRLVEMVELNRMFGANHFVFYNHSISDHFTDQALRVYQNEGLADVLPWQLSPGEVHNVHYYGQLAAINDCLYRSMSNSHYVVFTDLDEFIVPHGVHRAWSDIISSIRRKEQHSDRFGAFVFQNVFFPTNWRTTNPECAQRLNSKRSVLSLCQTRRESEIYSHGLRSKVIADPKTVQTAGVHVMWKMSRGYVTYDVSSDDGLLHHYRNWTSSEREHDAPEDTTVLRYKSTLIKRHKDMTRRVRKMVKKKNARH